MATKTADLPDIEELTEAVQGAFEGRRALWGSPAVVASSEMPFGGKALGKKVEIPYFNSIGDFEELPEGSALSPVKISASTEEALVRRAGKAFAITDWAHYLGMRGDPYEEAARQIVEGAFRHFDKVILEEASASLPAMTVDVYSATTPRTIDSDLILDGRAKWGDEADDPASLMICHSKVENDIRKLKDATGRGIFVAPIEGKLGNVMGYPVAVSDRVVPTPDTPPKYTTGLLKSGALALWYNGKPEAEYARDILAGADIVAIHIYFVVHRYLRLGPNSTKSGVVLLKHN